jgi:ABC-type transport system substrate-binding protein
MPSMPSRAWPSAGLSLDRWPVGTGPYMMTEFVQDRRHVMKRNPNYRGEPYPCEGMPGDKEAGLLDDCGKTMPFIDTMVFTIEREGVPLKNKFRQGFYDVEIFERTDTGMDYLVDMQDSEEVRREYIEKGFRLNSGTDVNSYFIGFNMLDPVIGDGADPGPVRAQPQAAPGDLDRHRLGGVLEDLPQEGRRRRR